MAKISLERNAINTDFPNRKILYESTQKLVELMNWEMDADSPNFVPSAARQYQEWLEGWYGTIGKKAPPINTIRGWFYKKDEDCPSWAIAYIANKVQELQRVKSSKRSN